MNTISVCLDSPWNDLNSMVFSSRRYDSSVCCLRPTQQYNEIDPRILQDVQRALQLKARREARMKRETITTPETARTYQESPASSPSEPPSKPPFVPDLSSPSSVSASPLRKSSNSTASDVDFSPSTGWFDPPSKLHPVPTSLDNGITLDWTGGSGHEGERRWTKSIVKKRDKDILPPLGVMIDEQEQMHKGVMEIFSNCIFDN
jgi:hypothetical protein